MFLPRDKSKSIENGVFYDSTKRIKSFQFQDRIDSDHLKPTKIS